MYDGSEDLGEGEIYPPDQDTRVTGSICIYMRGHGGGWGEVKIHPLFVYETMITDFYIYGTHLNRIVGV